MNLLFNELLRCLELPCETAILPCALQYFGVRSADEGITFHQSDFILACKHFTIRYRGREMHKIAVFGGKHMQE